MKHLLLIPLLGLSLNAYSVTTETEEQTPVSEPRLLEGQREATDEGDLAKLARTDHEHSREALRDPGQREVVMAGLQHQHAERKQNPEQVERREEMLERLRQRREETMAGREDIEPGKRLRELRAGAVSHWWEDQDITSQIELEEAQSKLISNAHESFTQTRRESRQSLNRAQRELQQALQAGDRSRIRALLDERQAASAAIAEAENEWLRALLEQLSDEQITTLAHEHPDNLMRPGR